MTERRLARVRDLWDADLQGKVSWAEGHGVFVGPVRLTWVSRDGRVVEGDALRPRALSARVTLPRFSLLELLERPA